MRLEVINVMGDSGPSDDYKIIDQSLEMKQWSWKWVVFSKCCCDYASHRCLLNDLIVQEPVLGLAGLLCWTSLSLSLTSPPVFVLVFMHAWYWLFYEMHRSWLNNLPVCGASDISDLLDCCYVSMLNYWNRSRCFLGFVKLNYYLQWNEFWKDFY